MWCLATLGSVWWRGRYRPQLGVAGADAAGRNSRCAAHSGVFAAEPAPALKAIDSALKLEVTKASSVLRLIGVSIAADIDNAGQVIGTCQLGRDDRAVGAAEFACHAMVAG
jgi:hypothetical protein